MKYMPSSEIQNISYKSMKKVFKSIKDLYKISITNYSKDKSSHPSLITQYLINGISSKIAPNIKNLANPIDISEFTFKNT